MEMLNGMKEDGNVKGVSSSGDGGVEGKYRIWDADTLEDTLEDKGYSNNTDCNIVVCQWLEIMND